MSLILRIIRFDKSSPPKEMAYQWDEMGGTIGRNGSNDWVLADSKRFLSGRHAAIKVKGGDYYITDTSTNGVFINRKPVPLGRDNSARLEPGDILKMGPYEIEVVLEQQKNKPSSAIPAMPFDAFDEPDDEASPLKSVIIDEARPDKANEILPELDTADTDTGHPPLLADWDETGKSGSDSVSHIPDPFFTDNEFNTGAESEHKPANFSALNKDDDPFAGLDDFFAPPKIATERSTEPRHNEAKQKIPANAQWDKEDTSDKSGDSSLPEIPDDFWGTTDNDNIADPFAREIPAPAVSNKNVAEPQPQPQSQQSDVEPATAREQVMAGFMRGLDVRDASSRQAIAQHLQPEMMGILFRILLQGCMDVLRARNSIKSEMRLEMTTLQPIENNPLKFSIDAEDALLKLLVPQGKSYMQPEVALTEAFDDIKAHQVAVIAGVQTSLKHVLKRFEPEKLVERLEKNGSVIDKIPIQRKAKLWELFEGLYSTIEEEAGDDFHHLFGLEFARAYDAEIAKLESMRMNK